MRNSIKWILCILSAAVILAALIFTMRDRVIAVSVLSDAAYSQILSSQSEGAPTAYRGKLLICGEDAPYDEASGTYYVPQSLHTADWDLPLTWSLGRYDAYLCPDPLFADKAAALAAGHTFSLLVTDGTEYFTQALIFTGMPMITLSRRTRAETNGKVAVMRAFDPDGGENGEYLVHRALTKHRLHGTSSRYWDKKSYRLSLQDAVGDPATLPLFGLRKDDDWILKSMYLDQQKMRDAVSCDLWNALCQSPLAHGSIPFSHTATTELVLFGDYNGMYCLLEPLDALGIGLDSKSDYLYKITDDVCAPGFSGEPILDEFQSIPPDERLAELSRQSVGDYIHTFFSRSEDLPQTLTQSYLDIDSIINISLFADATANCDFDEVNAFIRGTLQPDGAYARTLIPWDVTCHLAASCSA